MLEVAPVRLRQVDRAEESAMARQAERVVSSLAQQGRAKGLVSSVRLPSRGASTSLKSQSIPIRASKAPPSSESQTLHRVSILLLLLIETRVAMDASQGADGAKASPEAPPCRVGA